MGTHIHSRSSAQVLYRIYIQSWLSTSQQPFASIISPRIQPSPSASIQHHMPRLRQTFSTSSPQSYAKSRPPEVRTQRYDDEITARKIYLVDTSTGNLDPRVRNLWDVLSRLDRQTHRLVQVTPPEDEAKGEIPVCRIINKQEAYEAARRRKAVAKENKRLSGVAGSVKTLEINWAIDGNDLGHRLGKMAQFLAEGRKVEVVLASKKGGRRAALEECEDVLQRIRRAADNVTGAREVGMEGKPGGVFRLFLQGTPGKSNAKDVSNGAEGYGDTASAPQKAE